MLADSRGSAEKDREEVFSAPSRHQGPISALCGKIHTQRCPVAATNSAGRSTTIPGQGKIAMPSKYDLPDVFWAKVDKNGPVPPHCPELGACWIWTGYIATNGYGRIAVGRTARRGAHVHAYLLTYGPHESGLYICHHCDNPICVRPTHLYAGTHEQNTQDMVTRKRAASCTQVQIGEMNYRTALTDNDVVAIRRLHSQGASYRELARRFNIGKSGIGHIIRRERWAHLP